MEYLRNSAQRNNNKEQYFPMLVAAAQTALVVSTLTAVKELKMSYTLFGILIWTLDYWLIILLLPTT